jgi:hypothetical protein
MYQDTPTAKQGLHLAGNASTGMNPRHEALNLVRRLQAAHIVPASLSPPDEWNRLATLPVADVAATVRLYLSKSSWRQVIAAVRHLDHAATDRPLDLSDPFDFLATVELALAHEVATGPDELSEQETNEVAVAVAGEGATGATGGLQVQPPGEALRRPAGSSGWLRGPRALWARLNAFILRARATAIIDGALGDASPYNAWMRATDAERDIALARIYGLRAASKRILLPFRTLRS